MDDDGSLIRTAQDTQGVVSSSSFEEPFQNNSLLPLEHAPLMTDLGRSQETILY